MTSGFFLLLEKMLFVVNMFSTRLHPDLWNLIKKDRYKGTGMMWNLIKFFTAISGHVDFIFKLKLCQTLTDWLVQFHLRSKDEAKSEYWIEDDGMKTDIRIGNWFHCEPNDMIPSRYMKQRKLDPMQFPIIIIIIKWHMTFICHTGCEVIHMPYISFIFLPINFPIKSICS